MRASKIVPQYSSSFSRDGRLGRLHRKQREADRFVVVFASIWIDIGQAILRCRKRQDKVSYGRRIRSGDLSWGKVLRPVRSGSEPEKAQIVKPIRNGNRGKIGLDPPGGEKAVRRRGGHHTLAAPF